MSNLETPACPEWYQPLLIAVTEALPCGEDLEDDAAFLMLENRLQPRMGAEYGDFVESVDPVNWSEIERDVKTLLTRSLDLRLIQILIRCRFRRIGLPALEEGLRALIWALCQWPEQIYPQLYDSGEFEPLMRANVLAELESAEGLLADFRMQPLPKVSGLQLSVREFERGMLTPHADQALDENTLSLIQLGWQEQSASAILSLQCAEQLLLQLRTQLEETLGDDTPEFTTLLKLLALFRGSRSASSATVTQTVMSETAAEMPQPEAEPAPELQTEDVTPASLPPVPPVASPTTLQPVRGIQDRTDALMRLREIQQWFVRFEPSSPVGDLLTLTEQMVGKRFAELLQILPQDLIARLSNGQEP